MIPDGLPFGIGLPWGSDSDDATDGDGDDEAGSDGDDGSIRDRPAVDGESQVRTEPHARFRDSNDTRPQRDAAGGDDLPDVGDGHQTVLLPPTLERRPSLLHTGRRCARSLWIGEYPDAPVDGFLETLYAAAETQQTDISVHIRPRDTRATIDSLEDTIEDLEADYQYLTEKHRSSARGVQKDLQDHQEMYDVLRNTAMEAFDVSMYLTERGDTPADLDTADVRTTARQSPANLTPVTPRWAQLDAFVSSSPLGLDRFAETLDSRTPMLGGAVGAMFPFVSGAFAEFGIEYGAYALNSSPVIVDRFARETGYCTMVIGQLGAGKSFATKLRLLRRAMFDPETIIIMLDPMRGFAGVNEALGGERITVGGRRGLNPLEIEPTPVHVLRTVGDIDPWGEQITWVMAFFATFFDEVADHPLGARSQTLRRAVQQTYQERGITRDPTTHVRESPTIRDVIAVLEEMIDAPDGYGYATDGEQAAVQADAQSLLKDLRPSFREGGDLANLARPSEFDLDSRVIYLDLHQEEGTRGRAETSLMMQVLFNSVYERVKQTDKRVVFCIDEAHYLLSDAVSLDFLETAVRHSRHFDLSVEFITQTGGEFALTPETRTIANLCAVTILHRANEETEKIATWFDLSERQAEWVTTAKAGEDEEGYSEALIGIDQEGWFPLRIRASDYEAEVIDAQDAEPMASGSMSESEFEFGRPTEATGSDGQSPGTRRNGVETPADPSPTETND